MMSLNVKPGTKVVVKISKSPTNAAATKTLSRLFARGEGGRKARQDRKRLRASATVARRRGGRPWYKRPKAPLLFPPEAGKTCVIRVTLDVLKDLQRLERFVEVSAAT